MNANQEILQKLNVLIKLSAAQLANGKDFKEQVMLLSSVGLSPKDIADVLGKTANNVSVTLNYLKKKRGHKNGKKTK